MAHPSRVLLAVAFLTGLAFGQGSTYFRPIISPTGQALPNARVFVCQPAAGGVPCLPQAQIYTDYTLGTSETQPIFSDSNGNLSFGCVPGNYVIQVTYQGTTLTYNDTCASSGGSPVLVASQFPGSDAFAQINAAEAALPSTGGTIDARGFGATLQPVTTVLQVGALGKPVTLIMDANTQYLIGTTGGVDAIQLWSKSSLICENQTNATVYTFGLQTTANISTILSTYPKTSAGNLTYLQGCTFAGNAVATVTDALVTYTNPTDITTLRNTLFYNFFGVGLKIHSTAASGGVGPMNIENITANGSGNTGAQPVLITADTGASGIFSINFSGGSIVHPGPGGLAMVDIEGGSSGAVDGVNFFGTQFESINAADIGVLIDNARDIVLNGTSFTAASGVAGAACVKIAQTSSSTLGVIINNLYNINGYTNTINDTVNSIMDNRVIVTNYTMGSADSVIQRWVGAFNNTGEIASVTTTGLTLNGQPNTLTAGSGVPGGNCAKGSIYLNSNPADASHVLYVCAPANTWTAVTVP